MVSQSGPQEVKKPDTENGKDIENVLSKARRMIGLSPISEESVQYFLKDDIENKEEALAKAEVEAVKEYMEHFLKYSKESVDTLDIVTTHRSSKKEMETVYVTFGDEQPVKAIYRRAAMCRNEEMKLVTYIPPQIYKRYAKVEEICAQKRSNDREVKTQIRLGQSDLILLTKKRGDKYWEDVPLESLGGIPNIESNLDWSPGRKLKEKITDSPPKHVRPSTSNKRKNPPSPGNLDTPALGKKTDEGSFVSTDGI